MVVPLLASFACVDPAGPGPGVAAVHDSGADTGASTREAPRVPEPGYTADEAALAMTEALGHGLPTPLAPIDTWLYFMALGDDGCPGASRTLGGMEVVNILGCVSSTGVWYQGVGAAWSKWLETPNEGAARSYSMVFSADGTIADAEQQVFEFGGTIELTVDFDANDVGTLVGEVQGTYAYPGAEASWLAVGASLAQYWSGTVQPDGTYTLALEGGFSIGAVAVDTRGLTLGGDCGEQPTGTLGFRDDEGYWYDLHFDASTCDGCGELSFASTVALGRACVDVAGAFAEPISAVIAPTVDAP